jgi:hypothetical protein
MLVLLHFNPGNQMTKKEFKNAYGYYRKKMRESLGSHDWNTQEWVESLNPIPSYKCDMLELRAQRWNFAQISAKKKVKKFC